jgi:curved DNA-binding protein
MDPYKILGVEPGASEKDIKAAFKKLAKKHHPDVGGDEAKFKEINAAYSMLTDKNPHNRPPDHEEPFDGSGIFNEDIFDAIFRNMGMGAGMGTNRMITRLHVDPELILKGGQFNYQYTIVENFQGRLRQVKKTVLITLEADTPVGSQIVVPGTQPNVFIQVFPGNSNKYKISDGVHLTEALQINVFKAMTGGEIEVETPLGRKVSVKVPAGTHSGNILRLRAQGLRAAGGFRGDYNIQFFVKIPQIVAENKEEAKVKILEILEKEYE